MSSSKTTAVLAAMVIVASLGAVFVATSGTAPRLDTRIHEDIGRALAQEALKLLGPSGHLTVVTRDTGTFPQPALDLALGSFTQAIRKSGGSVPAVQALQVDPLRPLQVPPGDFHELIRRGAAGDVIVSLMGPPWLSEEQRGSLGEVKPKIVAFSPGTVPEPAELRLLAEQKLLHAAVISRPLKRNALKPANFGHESFDELYVRVSAADLAKLPAAGGHP